MSGYDDFGSGGWGTTLKKTSLGIGGDIAFLASENYTVKRAGITLDSSVVTADSNGDKILKAGTFVGPKADGKYARPENGGTFDGDVSGFLLESVNLRDGDVVNGLIIQGSVLRARITVASASSAAMNTALGDRIIFQ